jgi:phosphoenolpyruvate---glycerone phosphotransferase subunit DhaL
VGRPGEHSWAQVGNIGTVSNAAITTERLAGWLRRFHDLVIKNQTELTELDSAIGDADHGINMVRGMSAVMEKLDGMHPADVNELLKTVAMTLVTSVGGASGPLYGTFFLRFGRASGSASELDLAALATGLRAGLAGIVERGKADPGDKTMVDALSPALDAMETEIENGGDLAAAVTAARAAALPWYAMVGRGLGDGPHDRHRPGGTFAEAARAVGLLTVGVMIETPAAAYKRLHCKLYRSLPRSTLSVSARTILLSTPSPRIGSLQV